MLLVFFCEINIFRVFFLGGGCSESHFQKFTPGIVEFRGLFGVIGRDDDVSLGPHSHGHLQNSQIAGALQHGVLGGAGMGIEPGPFLSRSAGQGELGQPRFLSQGKQNASQDGRRKNIRDENWIQLYEFSSLKCPLFFNVFANSLEKPTATSATSVRCGRDDDLGLPMKAMFQDIRRGKVTWVEVTYVCHHKNYEYANIHLFINIYILLCMNMY